MMLSDLRVDFLWLQKQFSVARDARLLCVHVTQAL